MDSHPIQCVYAFCVCNHYSTIIDNVHLFKNLNNFCFDKVI